jgi:hypothetical protein
MPSFSHLGMIERCPFTSTFQQKVGKVRGDFCRPKLGDVVVWAFFHFTSFVLPNIDSTDSEKVLGLHNVGQLPVAQWTGSREGFCTQKEFLDALVKSLGERYADSFSNDRNSTERSRSVQENSPSTPAKEPKLLDQLRLKMRMLHVATRTEEAYIA